MEQVNERPKHEVVVARTDTCDTADRFWTKDGLLLNHRSDLTCPEMVVDAKDYDKLLAQLASLREELHETRQLQIEEMDLCERAREAAEVAYASLREENLLNFAARMELQDRVQVLESRLREYRRYTQSAHQPCRRRQGMTGIDLIAAERERQVNVEGWTPAHDDRHNDGALASAGATYAIVASNMRGGASFEKSIMDYKKTWPFEDGWFKPSDNPIRDLVKAGAMIAAEIDVILREKNR
jgi:hypothetical protein